MRSIGVVFARRAGIVAAVTAVAVALLSAPAQAATPPDLTGYWINVAAPSLPGWALQATNGLSSLHASWHGTAAQGHPHLVGSFNGTLNQAGTAYSGGYDIEESGSHPGSMTITIDSPSQITISFDGGAGGTYTFQRGVAAAMAPATGWCTSASAPGPSCQTDAA